MAKILVLYYSMYGHIETMAHAVAEGANKVDGVEVVVKRVPETMQAEVLPKQAGKRKTRPSPRRRSWLSTTPSSLVPQPVSAICPDRCAPFSIRPAACGRPERCTANWPAYSAQPVPAAVRSKPSPRLDHACPPRDDYCTDWLRRPGAV